jgi:hypothetical protein
VNFPDNLCRFSGHRNFLYDRILSGEGPTMKSNSILAMVFVAAVAPLAIAGTQSMQSKTAASGRSASTASVKKAGAGQKTAHAVGNNAVGLKSGTQISAKLLTSLDARHAKPGKKVVAKVNKDVKQNGHTVIRKGSKLVGHVVSVQASGKGNAGSRMEVAFDHLLQGKSSTALNAVVTSILSVPSAPAPEPMPMPAPMAMGAPAGGSGGGGLVGGATGAVGSTVGAVGSVAGGAVGATGQVASSAAGDVGNTLGATANSGANGKASAGMANGLGNIQLGGSGQASNQTGANSVFSTRKGNLNLHSGTQLQLQVVGSASTRTPAKH